MELVIEVQESRSGDTVAMKVQDVMTKQVATCRADTSLAEASALLWENDCGALPVIGVNGEIAGMVTDRDICIALGTRNARSSELRVIDVVQNHVLYCNLSDDVHTALQRMGEGQVRRLPVVNDEFQIEGILSMDDVVLKALPDDRMGAAVSYADAVTTLQSIYRHSAPAGSKVAA